MKIHGCSGSGKRRGEMEKGEMGRGEGEGVRRVSREVSALRFQPLRTGSGFVKQESC